MNDRISAFDDLMVTGGGMLGDRRDADDLLGSTIGAFKLTDILGRGGMSTVYLAERRSGGFEQTVAVKVLEFSDSPSLVAGFETERQILGALDHPHIGRIYDGGTLPDGRPYLIMEYVSGDAIDAHADLNELGLDARLDLLDDLAEAVQAAHEQSICHLDLKPDNALVDRHGVVKLLDFGISTVKASASTDLKLATPRYAAPEQLADGATDQRTDVFQLGIIAYLLITGRHPAAGARRGALTDQMMELPKTLASQTGPFARRLDASLDRIMARAFAANPANRYSEVAQFRDDLTRWRNGLRTSVDRQASPARIRRLSRRHRWSLGVSVATVLAMTAAVFTWLDYRHELALARQTSEMVTKALEAESDDQISQTSFELESGALAHEPELEARVAANTAEELLAGGKLAEVVSMTEAVIARRRGGFESQLSNPALYSALGEALRRMNRLDDAEHNLLLADRHLQGPAGDLARLRLIHLRLDKNQLELAQALTRNLADDAAPALRQLAAAIAAGCPAGSEDPIPWQRFCQSQQAIPSG